MRGETDRSGDVDNEIAETRDEFGGTVADLAEADLKSRAHTEAERLKDKTREAASAARRNAPLTGTVGTVVVAAGGAIVLVWLRRRAAKRTRWERARHSAGQLAAQTADRLHAGDLAARTGDLAARTGELASNAGDRLRAGEKLAADAGGQLRDLATGVGETVRSSDAMQAAAASTATQGRRLARSHRAQGATTAAVTILALEGVRRRRASRQA
ncbi:hypothetical protein [Spirillospora sp. NPDC047279]|uniref:hypothetical protein n=1 Tax=Spirillospora sp. NPDC047279 TaxID=3155478 RepID=UPI0033D50771